MSLQPSSSESASSYDRLHPEIRRWVREEGWSELRDVQDRAISTILDGNDDVLISAATAAGKTEAAFLPLLTLAADRTESGLSILYVSPLKALINDQHRRLELLCERLELPLVKWHGDALQSAKKRTLRSPAGVALITPESIEALFLRRSTDAYRLLGSLDAILIDELHAFLAGPRGLHLASLLKRIDAISERRARRIGLSATLGDFAAAKRWLCPTNPNSVQLLEAKADNPEIRLQVRGYVDPPNLDVIDDLEGEGEPDSLGQIADHLHGVLRGSNNLVFAGSRRTVEALADRLRRRSEKSGVPAEFFPHHGSLSKELREELEQRLKAGTLPTSAVATTTLELGIDLGSVKSVAQIGAPRSLGALRQRLGRSGRRAGTPAILRVYVREKYLSADSDPLDRLRVNTVRAVAAVRLLLKHFVEPPMIDPSLLTVALHQILSIIAEKGDMRADQLHRLICGPGPFADLGKSDFIELLRAAAGGEAELLEQGPDGAIMLGRMGERLVAGRDFYAVFQSDEEWRLVADGRALDTIPIVNLLGVGSLLGFAGRRWRVIAVDDPAKVLQVAPHPSGRLPKFDRLASEPIHDRLAQEMLAVYADTDVPTYLDATGLQLLLEGRTAFADLGLSSQRLVQSGRDTHVLLWRGTAVNSIVAILMMAAGLECEAHDVGITVADAQPSQLVPLLANIGECPLIENLAEFVQNLRFAKYDNFLPETLLRHAWAERHSHLREEVTMVLGELSQHLMEAGPLPS